MASPTTVSFPVIAAAVPAMGCTANEFLDQVVQKTPHWIYHLRIRASRRGRYESRFTPISSEHVRQLARFLQLPRGFCIEPREFVQGAIALPPGKRSEYVFGYPAFFRAGSSDLALAVGLVAAATGRHLPPQVLLSGHLEEPLSEALRLSETTSIHAKVCLCFGRDPGYVLEWLLKEWYAEPNTSRWLGPREARTEPGKVRLFITADETDIDPRAFVGSLSTVALAEVSLRDFGKEEFKDLLSRVEELAEDGLLLVQVPTAFHALALLGYQHVHGPILDRHADLLQQPIRVFRVRHGLGAPPLDDEGAVRQVLERLKYELEQARAQDVYTRLNIILDQSRRLLKCQSADIVARGRDLGLLRVLARIAPQQEGLPHFVPCARGGPARVLGERRTRVVEVIEKDEEHAAALTACDPRTGPFTETQCQKYRALLEGIKAYVKVPLCHAHDVLGAMYLHRDSVGTFNARMIRLVEALAQRAAEEVEAFLREEREAVQRVAPLWGTGSVEDLARRAASVSPSSLQAELGAELARMARDRAGAYRAAVRLLSDDRESLIPIGFSSIHEDASADEQAPCLCWEDDAAASYAVRSGRNYIIIDTDGGIAGMHLRNIPPRPRCHATILLRVGGHILGVLSVDWERAGTCGPTAQAMLEGLAGRYALALKAHSTDELFARLERLCAAAARPEQEPDYPRFVRLVARMVGAAEAALFLRRDPEGPYHLAFSLRNPHWGEERCYAVGEGLTGWVAQKNRAVRVADLRDERELAALGAPRQVWLHERYTGEEMKGLGYSFLCVPVAVGNDVMGVLQANAARAGGFSSYDQHIALSAASRLAGCLHQRHEQRTDGQHLHQTLELMRAYCRGLQQQPHDLHKMEVDLLRGIGDALIDRLGSDVGWLWLAREERDELLHCCHAWSVPRESWPKVEQDGHAFPAFDQGFVLFGEPRRDRRLEPLVSELAEEYRRRLDDRQWFAVPVRVTGRLLALFFLAVPPARRLGRPWIDSVVRMLQPVGEMIAETRRLNQAQTQAPATKEAPPP
jgi:transcriptional regulator with GAF, ATPase, and Fis domain